MLIIAGRLEVQPDDRDRYVTDCATVVEQARRAPGCLDFTIGADPLDPSRVNVYERWESDERLLAFRGAGSDGDDRLSGRILGAEVRKYRISATEDP